MIEKYSFGDPVNTEAVVEPITTKPGTPGIGTLSLDNGFSFSLPLEDDDLVYGLGETVRGINKRGWIYSNCNKDDPAHTEGKHGLYASHNFVMIYGKTPVGFFFDYPGFISFDIGVSDSHALTVHTDEASLFLYVIRENNAESVIQRFRKMIGTSYIPPKWAFGFQQSRWGYKNEADIREVVKKHKDADIPLESVCLDIDYMDHCKDFTVDSGRFSDFGEFIRNMKDQGIHIIPIIDAGIKEESGYPVYEEGHEKGYFVKDKEGKDFIIGVWPGRSVLVDVLNEEAREWLSRQFAFLTRYGVEGIWSDMNEPAIFWSLDAMYELWNKVPVSDYGNEELLTRNFARLQSGIQQFADNRKDYKKFFHHMNGRKLSHEQVHNIFGYFMTRAATEGMALEEPDKRKLIYTRSSYIGMHRYSGVWTGDNCSWWSHLLLNIKMMPSLNMCGFLYAGADIGGFGDDCTGDLMLRWLAFGMFTPLMRNHSHLDFKRQEFYQFENQAEYRELIRLRYRLIPYLYSEFVKAADSGKMMFRPLAMDYPQDNQARHLEDQLMLGDELMLAPVYEQNAAGRYVYLPEEMLFIKFTDSRNYLQKKMEKGIHFIEVALHEVPLFLRPGKMLPLADPANQVDKIKTDRMEFIANGKGASYLLYEDDGISVNRSSSGKYTELKSENSL